MYHILVVDDEMLMRKYLANSIPAFTDKFQVSGIAKDGLEAMELLKKQHYDLVITDIQMPEVDGLSLAKYLHENFPDMAVIIISGFNDFEYARKAIKYQVTDYLLKPLVDQTLTDLLETIAERLKAQSGSQFLLQENLSSDAETKKQLLLSIIEENTKLTYELFRKLENSDLTLMSAYGCILEFTIDELDLILKNNTAFDVTTDHLKLNQIVQDICEGYGYLTLYNANGSTFVLVSEDSISQLSDHMTRLCQQIRQGASEQDLPKLTAICGKTVTDIMDLTFSMQSIQEMLPVTLIAKSYPVTPGLADAHADFIGKIHKLSDNIFTDYLVQSSDKLYIDIKNFCLLFQEKRSFTTIMRYASYLIQYISERSNINPSCLRKAYAELTRQVNTYLPAGLPDESAATQIITGAVTTLIPLEPKPLLPESVQIVTAAKEFILSHYQENISLSDVADHCGVSNSYLSDLFHKKLNEPYTKFILRIRMEQAVRLLRQNPDIRIYTIAEQTGFVSVKHFNTVFKKYYGVTPTGYLKDK